MHDLILTLAKFVSGSTRFSSEVNSSDEVHALFGSSRRLSMHYHKAQPVTLKCLPWFKILRSLKISRATVAITVTIPEELFTILTVLRVLDLSDLGLTVIHETIRNMKHLCYLGLSRNDMKKLPDSITELIGLQTLNIQNCSYLVLLPEGMKAMISLRHLLMDPLISETMISEGTHDMYPPKAATPKGRIFEGNGLSVEEPLREISLCPGMK